MSRTQFTTANTPEQNFTSMMANIDAAPIHKMNNAQKQALMRVLPTLPPAILMDQTTNTQLSAVLSLFPQLAAHFMSEDNAERQARFAAHITKEITNIFPTYIHTLSSHADDNVRLALANNAFVTKNFASTITRKLAKDENNDVRTAALYALHAQNISHTSPHIKHA